MLDRRLPHAARILVEMGEACALLVLLRAEFQQLAQGLNRLGGAALREMQISQGAVAHHCGLHVALAGLSLGDIAQEEGILLVRRSQFIEDLERPVEFAGVKKGNGGVRAPIGVLRELLERPHRRFERIVPLSTARRLAALLHCSVKDGPITSHS